MASIFNKTLVTKVMPSDWQTALGTPIHKNGSTHVCAMYKSVSLTLITCKIMKRFVRTSIWLQLTRNNPLNKAQHEFIPKRSTLTDLLSVLEDYWSLIDAEQDVDMVFLYQSKVFDVVNHNIPHNLWMGSICLLDALYENSNWWDFFTWASSLQWSSPKICRKLLVVPYLH